MQGKVINIEESWIRQNPLKSEGVLHISPKEWEAANSVAGFRVLRGEKLPFKLSKEELIKEYPELAARFNHDLLVLPTNSDPPFKVGIMARSEIYTDETTEEKVKVKEGILGHGAFGVAKIIQWENGEVDAVKIEDAGQEKEHEAEKQIMQDLGYLKATFVERRSVAEPWIGGKQIQHVLYTVQQRHVGIEMRNFFSGFAIKEKKTGIGMSDVSKYEIGLRAALAIEHLHDLNILHCDIKPANFMINFEGSTAVVAAVDFGLSMRLKEGQKEIKADSNGTPMYVAPEVCEYKRGSDGRIDFTQDVDGESHVTILSEHGRYSKAADVFSLGIMFRDDLKLGAPDSPLHDLVKRMTAHNPEERPSMHEVAAAMLNPGNYNKFKQLYQNLDKYTAEKKPSWIYPSKRIKATDQIGMVKTLEGILKEYRLATKDDTQVDQAVDKIISIMKENQSRHKDAVFSTASTFNIQTLQSLPEELRSGVCKKLGINADSAILKNTDYSTRKELATIIDKHGSLDQKSTIVEHKQPGLF